MKFNINKKKFQIVIVFHMWASSSARMCGNKLTKKGSEKSKIGLKSCGKWLRCEKIVLRFISHISLCYYHTSCRHSLVIQSTSDDCLHVYVTLSFTLSKSSKWLRAYKARLSEFVSMLFYASCDKNPFSFRRRKYFSTVEAATAVSYMLKHKLKLDFSKAATIEDNMFT